MQLIPPALVPAAQAALRNQGLDPNIFGPNGDLNAAGLVGLAFNQVTVRTGITPDITFPISASGAPPSQATQELLNQLQPTVLLSGPGGSYVLAPYGQAQGTQSWWPLVLLGVGGLGFVGWALFGK